MDHRLQPFKEAAHKTLERLKKDLSGLQVGRASPSLVEGVLVEAYGAMAALHTIASIQAPEPRTLVIQLWDRSLIKEAERALVAANLGASPAVDGELIRLNFPIPTEERRQEFVKKAKQLGEECKIALKGPREQCLKEWKELEKKGELSEDIHFRLTEELQRETDEIQKEIRTLVDKKEKEITTV
ncbi:MAG: ribosome recycling factor [bacterium]